MRKTITTLAILSIAALFLLACNTYTARDVAEVIVDCTLEQGPQSAIGLKMMGGRDGLVDAATRLIEQAHEESGVSYATAYKRAIESCENDDPSEWIDDLES